MFWNKALGRKIHCITSLKSMKLQQVINFLTCVPWRTRWSPERFKMRLPENEAATPQHTLRSQVRGGGWEDHQRQWAALQKGTGQHKEPCRDALPEIRDCTFVQAYRHCLWSAVLYGIQKPLLETVDLRENYTYFECMYKDKRAKFIFAIPADIRRDECHSLQPGKAR